MSQNTILKQKAALFAVNNFVKSGMVIGLGEGSTAIFALHHIAELLKQEHLSNIRGIASSINIEKATSNPINTIITAIVIISLINDCINVSLVITKLSSLNFLM